MSRTMAAGSNPPTIGPVATPAAAASGCRAVRPQNGFYEAGRVASEMLTVPANARCTTTVTPPPLALLR